MADYRLTETEAIIRTIDRAYIPNDTGNSDRIDFNKWVAAGNTPDPYVKPADQVLREQRQATLDADATRADLLTRLRTATPAQINSYVDANVTTLAEARALFKRILLVLSQP